MSTGYLGYLTNSKDYTGLPPTVFIVLYIGIVFANHVILKSIASDFNNVLAVGYNSWQLKK